MKVSIIGVNKGNLSKASLERIRKCGVEVVMGAYYDADIIFTRNKLENFSKFRKVKWIHTSWAGVNTFLTEEMKKSDVIVTNSKEAYETVVPEHALSLILAFNRGLKHAFLAQNRLEWREFEPADELYGKTVGIIGAGSIGTNIAKLCKPFGCKTVGVRKSGKKTKYIDKALPVSKLGVLLKESDYVVIAVPLTAETRHMIGKKEFAKMKKSAVIVNVGRGAVIDENAMTAALQGGKIRGACLDVFETEPLPKSSPLWKMPNVLITAHYAGYTPLHEGRIIDIFCKNLEAFMKGGKMANVVDKKRGY